jgi:hypothetical protein
MATPAGIELGATAVPVIVLALVTLLRPKRLVHYLRHRRDG